MSEGDIDFYYRLLARIKSDPRFFCEHVLRIKDKEGNIVPLVFNSAQEKVFSLFFKQYIETRKVRLVILKARQQGISTLCLALCLWFSFVCLGNAGLEGILVARKQSDAKENIFSKLAFMSRWLKQALPFLQIIPETTSFDVSLGKTLSHLKGAWAESKSENRGGTCQFAHLTEVDLYPDWNNFWAGTSSAIAPENSIVLIESTGRGHNALWSMFQKKESNGYEIVFIPWFEQKEYAIEGDELPVLTEEQKLIQKTYNLTDAQMRWYAAKEDELGSSVLMKRDYPCCLDDAFAVDDDCSFFSLTLIEEASRRAVVKNDMPIILGIDPSKTHDNTAMVWRKGVSVIRIRNLPPQGGTAPLVKKVVEELSLHPADEIYIDAAGSSLSEYLFKDYGIYSKAINFGGSADKNELYMNKRAEMYARAARWLERHKGSIPNDGEFKKQLSQIKYIPGKPRLQLMDKSLLPKSPDIADAFALTFAGGLEDWVNIGDFNIDLDVIGNGKPTGNYDTTSFEFSRETFPSTYLLR